MKCTHCGDPLPNGVCAGCGKDCPVPLCEGCLDNGE